MELDGYSREQAYYRFMNEVASVSRHYFESCELETGAFVRAKTDLMMADEGTGSAKKLGALARLVEGGKFYSCVTHLYNATFCMRNPRKEGESLRNVGR